jgi:hypothetical protein
MKGSWGQGSLMQFLASNLVPRSLTGTNFFETHCRWHGHETIINFLMSEYGECFRHGSRGTHTLICQKIFVTVKFFKLEKSLKLLNFNVKHPAHAPFPQIRDPPLCFMWILHHSFCLYLSEALEYWRIRTKRLTCVQASYTSRHWVTSSSQRRRSVGTVPRGMPAQFHQWGHSWLKHKLIVIHVYSTLCFETF